MADSAQVMKSIGERPACRGHDVVTIPPASSVADAIEQLAAHNIGALVITDDTGRAIGVLSERDVIKGLAAAGTDVLASSVDELMTKSIIGCAPTDGLFAAVTRMLEHGIRHLLIVDDGVLLGLVTIRDLLSELVKKERTEREMLVEMVDAIRRTVRNAKADNPPDDVVAMAD